MLSTDLNINYVTGMCSIYDTNHYLTTTVTPLVLSAGNQVGMQKSHVEALDILQKYPRYAGDNRLQGSRG